MIYQVYQAQSDMMRAASRHGARAAARPAARQIRLSRHCGGAAPRGRLRDHVAAWASAIAGRLTASTRFRSAIARSRWSRKRRTRRRSAPCCISARIDAAPQPRVLLVAPLSGHFATLLRDTVRTMLPDHDVYLTDWHNARDVATQPRPLRPRRIYRSSDPVPRKARRPARISLRSASRRCRRWPRPRSWRRTTIRRSRAA